MTEGSEKGSETERRDVLAELKAEGDKLLRGIKRPPHEGNGNNMHTGRKVSARVKIAREIKKIQDASKK